MTNAEQGDNCKTRNEALNDMTNAEQGDNCKAKNDCFIIFRLYGHMSIEDGWVLCVAVVISVDIQRMWAHCQYQCVKVVAA